METKESLYSTQTLSAIESAIVNALLYFDIFCHPLTEEEIFEYGTLLISDKEKLQSYLNGLAEKGWIYQFDTFYAITNNEEQVIKRITGNNLAKKYLKRAILVSRFISWFPYVRGIMLSGSLSKGYMDKGSDIDYFIVTENKRLWLCRTLLAVCRKLMIGGFKKYFCINYFVTVDALKIHDENIFTATEIAFVYPTYNADVYNKMQQLNGWINVYYPNKTKHKGNVNSKKYLYSCKAIIEKMFNGYIGEKLDGALFKFMLNRWKKRYSDFDESQFDLNIRTKKNVSKQHEKGYQKVVLDKLEEKIKQFEELHGVKL